MADAASQPNILIFMTDHQRGDTVLPEHPVIKPNLAQFVRQGLTFTEAFCPSPHCCPSRATFQTGLYPSRHGVWNNICNGQALSRGLKPGVRCWSEDLAEAGYQLAYAGKWHVSVEESPKDRGFEELGEIFGHLSEPLEKDWDKYSKLAATATSGRRGEGQILRPGYGTHTAYRSWQKTAEVETHDDRVVQLGIDALPRLARNGRPWAMQLNTAMPHDPYNVPTKYLDMYRLEDVPLPASFADTMMDKPRIVQRMRRQIFGQMSEREVREAIRHFWAMCTYLDDLFGKLLAALEATGQADNTLVLYCADHGDYCGEHGLFAKGIPCFRGAYNVPAVIRWPKGLVEPGRRVSEFVSLADFAPTFTELAGRKADAGLTGRSLVPFLRKQTPPDWRDEMHTQCNGVELYYTQRSVMTRKHKYVFNGFDDDELYDLERDPHEMTNLAGKNDYEAVKRELCRRMWRFARREQDAATNGYITVGLAPYGPGEAILNKPM